MEKPKLQAQKRKIVGRKVKKLRREGILPANLYGKNIKSESLTVSLGDFQKIYTEVGETGLIDLDVEGKSHPILIHNVQIQPVTGAPLHVDFHEVSLTEKTKATVPIEVSGEAPAVVQKIGILIQPISEIEVEALPQDLPERILVDISKLEAVDQAITVADLNLDKKVEVKIDPAEIVVKIGPLEKEEVVAPPAPVEGEVPAEGAAEPTGEAPAENQGETPASGGEEKPVEEKKA